MWTFIFDIGGVLLDFDLPGLAQMASRGDAAIAQRLLALRNEDSLRILESGLMSGEDYFSRYIQPVVPHWTYRSLVEGWKAVFSENRDGLQLLNRARALGAPVYFLSNLADFNKTAIDEQFPGFFSRSDRNFLSFEMGCVKPDAAIFDRVLKGSGADPRRCLFLDDTPGHVAGAKAAGLHSLVFEAGKVDLLWGQIEKVMKSEPDRF
jgi:FMN phosphatase YigB (HAD superfamily)